MWFDGANTEILWKTFRIRKTNHKNNLKFRTERHNFHRRVVQGGTNVDQRVQIPKVLGKLSESIS